MTTQRWNSKPQLKHWKIIGNALTRWRMTCAWKVSSWKKTRMHSGK